MAVLLRNNISERCIQVYLCEMRRVQLRFVSIAYNCSDQFSFEADITSK